MNTSMSFQEKSLWLVFLSLLLTFLIYFYLVFSRLLPTPGPLNVLPNQVALFVTVVVLLVIMQVVGHIVIAITDRHSQTDERDQLIELKGTRNASYVLASGVFFALCAALFTQGNFVFTHVLLGFWVLAQLVQIGSQLFWYRRGV